jgi:hypothetical protein
MCNAATLDLIERVVDEKIQRDEMFTAFDVSLAVKDLARSEGVQEERHRHMKGAIHQEMDQYTATGHYQRTLQDVGAGTPAWLYFPATADPSQYVPQQRRDVPQQPATTPTTPTVAPSAQPVAAGFAAVDPTDTDDGDQVDSVGRKPDARGTLTVPNALLRAAGFNHHDTAYVTSRTDDQGRPQLVITKRATSQPITTYTVDHAENVRVTKKALQDAGFGGTDITYDFDGTNDEVVVSAHK